MPSKSLAVPPSTHSPTALFTQTPHSRQILTPLLSFTSALLPHSFLSRATSARDAVRGKSSRLFPTACALFAKTTGVHPSRHSPISALQLLTAVDSILTGMHSRKPFRMNTYRKQGGGGSLTRFSSGGLHTASPRFSSRLPARPRTCTLSPATGRNNHDRSA